MSASEKIESETHHNQQITQGAANRVPSTGSGKPPRKVIALQLDEREQAALAFLGGVPGLKKLLCPKGICIKCRVQSAERGTRLDSLCPDCQHEEVAKENSDS